jgi:hypothetical protein
MQDRYAGDVGDFIKLGLLRHIARTSESQIGALRPGINWYLTGDEAHNQDGKHTGYLDLKNRSRYAPPGPRAV